MNNLQREANVGETVFSNKLVERIQKLLHWLFYLKEVADLEGNVKDMTSPRTYTGLFEKA